MALSAGSKQSLNAIFSLLTVKDTTVISALADGARRRLDATNRGYVVSVLPTDGESGTPQPTAAAALATLIADIAAN